jgi:amino acid transporter
MNTESTGFSRSLGPVGIAFLTFSALSPAASVYIYGSGVIHIAGTGAIAGLIIGGIAVAIVSWLYAEIASAYPNAGGIFPAFAKILGPVATFPYIVMMLFVAPALLAFLLLGVANNIVAVAPGLPHITVAICCLCAAAAIAVLNVQQGALITGLFLVIEVIALGVITTVAALHPTRALLATVLHPVIFTNGGLSPMPSTLLGIAIAAAAFTCGGASWAANFAQEMMNPEQRIGKVITWISPLAALSIAGPLILALLAAPDLAGVLASDAPAATFLRA